MTIASHGFPHGDAVLHPTSGGKEIGKIVKRIPHTDIGLVKLHACIYLENEIFESAVDGAGPTRLTGLDYANNTKTGYNSFMNNPFTGYSEGTFGGCATQCVPSGDPQAPPFDLAQCPLGLSRPRVPPKPGRWGMWVCDMERRREGGWYFQLRPGFGLSTRLVCNCLSRQSHRQWVRDSIMSMLQDRPREECTGSPERP